MILQEFWEPLLLQTESQHQKCQLTFINMASENKGAFADQQFQCTKKAHEFYHALGTPSTSDFIAIICMNVIEIIL